MSLSEYAVLFVLVAIMGAGLPGPGDASLIAAGTLAGEGKLNVGIVLATAMVAWMAGSVAGYEIGVRGGRQMLDHPGRLEKRRRKLLAKGDRAFGRHTFAASVTMPAFVSGIFRVRFWLFMLGALVAGVGWIGMYVGLAYFLGEEVARRVGNAGTKALLGVIVLVAVGLGIRAGWSWWRASRQDGTASAASRLAVGQGEAVGEHVDHPGDQAPPALAARVVGELGRDHAADQRGVDVGVLVRSDAHPPQLVQQQAAGFRDGCAGLRAGVEAGDDDHVHQLVPGRVGDGEVEKAFRDSDQPGARLGRQVQGLEAVQAGLPGLAEHRVVDGLLGGEMGV
jgi:membrane protein DedA with SNARE-associated domain